MIYIACSNDGKAKNKFLHSLVPSLPHSNHRIYNPRFVTRAVTLSSLSDCVGERRRSSVKSGDATVTHERGSVSRSSAPPESRHEGTSQSDAPRSVDHTRTTLSTSSSHRPVTVIKRYQDPAVVQTLKSSPLAVLSSAVPILVTALIFILFHQTLVAKENTDTHRYMLNIQIYKYADTNTRIPRWRQLDCMTCMRLAHRTLGRSKPKNS